ncbi:hypothetical protein IMZ48_45135 [Candidatus Bathyarchaeota archaeon]|nr:hypothetical protein [Candidatus Bathyarchaeota archaeon]
MYVYPGVDWPPGTGGAPNYNQCWEGLKGLVDDCSRPSDDDNKANVKAGGKRSVGPFTYRIEPLFQRFDYNKPKAGLCYCKRETKGFPHLDCHVWGRGWGADNDNGVGLGDNFKGCMDVSFFFSFFLFLQ